MKFSDSGNVTSMG